MLNHETLVPLIECIHRSIDILKDDLEKNNQNKKEERRKEGQTRLLAVIE
jgi:hypothetical protein